MLTAEENILLPLSIAGTKADKAAVASLVARVGLGDRLGHKPSQLSGGQQQRVAIARALVSRPTVLFADEPTGNLDSTSGTEVLALLREAVELDQQTTVMVTHDPRAAASADRVLFLADGRDRQRPRLPRRGADVAPRPRQVRRRSDDPRRPQGAGEPARPHAPDDAGHRARRRHDQRGVHPHRHDARRCRLAVVRGLRRHGCRRLRAHCVQGRLLDRLARSRSRRSTRRSSATSAPCRRSAPRSRDISDQAQIIGRNGKPSGDGPYFGRASTRRSRAPRS